MRKTIQNWAFIAPKMSRDMSEYFEGLLDAVKADPTIFLHNFTFRDENLEALVDMDGIVSYTVPPSAVTSVFAAHRRKLPPTMVITMCKPENPAFAYAHIDPNGVAEKVFHLLSQRRCRSFGFCSSHAPFYIHESAALLKSYRRFVFANTGKMPRLFRPISTLNPNLIPTEVERFASWLKAQALPCGMFVHGDDVARKMLDACRLRGIKVPQMLRVISTGNSPMYCERTFPTLSSYAVQHAQTAMEAARRLRRMIDDGWSAKRASFEVQLPEVVERASSIDEHGRSRIAHEALDYIRLRLQQGSTPSANDIAFHLDISLRKIEKDFRDVYGHTLRDEIATCRMDLLCKSLRTSNEPIKVLVARSGFNDMSQATRVFKATTGLTMTQYRNRQRA